MDKKSVFDVLREWTQGGEEQRSWIISNYMPGLYYCRLLWQQDHEMGYLEAQCPSPEEAVEKAIKKFEGQHGEVESTDPKSSESSNSVVSRDRSGD